MSRLAIVLAVLGLSLTGCAAYGGDYDRPGYSTRYYGSSPASRAYYDDRDYRWHRDRYQDRRHSHYAPGYDGRYQWHDERGRYDRHREQSRRYVHPQNKGWQPPRQQSWKPSNGHVQRNYSHDRRERGWEQRQYRRHSQPAYNGQRGWSISR